MYCVCVECLYVEYVFCGVCMLNVLYILCVVFVCSVYGMCMCVYVFCDVECVCVCACVQNQNCASDGRKQLGKEERHQLVSCLVHLEHAQVL